MRATLDEVIKDDVMTLRRLVQGKLEAAGALQRVLDYYEQKRFLSANHFFEIDKNFAAVVDRVVGHNMQSLADEAKQSQHQVAAAAIGMARAMDRIMEYLRDIKRDGERTLRLSDQRGKDKKRIDRLETRLQRLGTGKKRVRRKR